MSSDNGQNGKAKRNGRKTGAPQPCPICGEKVEGKAETFPFCSKRCRQIDLGKWLGGEYVISRPIEQSDLEEGE
ncbi:MAG: DNA gyrase inhibitor YacG [Phycisphaeraceae bacterium]